MDFKDLFSLQAKDYAKYRPHYPESLFQYLASLSEQHQLAWDCGTGNGQAAIQLAGYYSEVIATDPSEKQLQSAEMNSKIIYQVGSAESSPLHEHSVDLITVAQAFHWFNHVAFFEEVKRVLKPQGILAVWSYNLCRITPRVDGIIDHLYGPTLGSFWEKERKLVEEGYKNCFFPLSEIVPPAFEMKAMWTLSDVIGYLGTCATLKRPVRPTPWSETA